MTRIESDKIYVGKSIEDVYHFLCDMRNYSSFMPDDVKKFDAQESHAELAIQGIGDLTINLDEKREYSFIKIIPKGKLPIEFHMFWDLAEVDGVTEVTAGANAKLNMFMRMMVEPKLKSFVNGQIENLKKAIEENA